MSAFLHQPGTSRESGAQTQGHRQQGEASVLNDRALRPPASQGGEPGPTTVALSSSVCTEGPVPGPGSKEVQAPIAGPCGRTVHAPTTPRPPPSQARPPRSADAPPRALGPAPGLGKQACPGREEPIKACGLFSSSLAASHFKMKIINTNTHRLYREGNQAASEEPGH